MITFSDFVHQYYLKNKIAQKIKLQNVLFSIGLDNVDIYVRDGPFSSDIGTVNLHPSKGTHWVLNINDKYFDSYGYSPPQTLSKFFKKRNGRCVYSEHKIQGLTNKRNSYCASYCFYILYFTEVLGTDFKSAISNLYYQMIH